MVRVGGEGDGGGGGASVVLIDAGIGPRTMAKRLAGTGVQINDIQAVCLTHLDFDHFRPTWVPVLIKHQIPIYLDRNHLAGLSRADPQGWLRASGLVRVFETDSAELTERIRIQPVRLPHDRTGSTGYLLVSTGDRTQSLGYATDLGRVPREMIDRFFGVDLLAIESNYDTQMQIDSPRPTILKDRIMGGTGHLSNAQAFDAVAQIAGDSQKGCPSQIVLLHRSRQCNNPDCIRGVFGQDPRLAARVTLAEQSERTDWLAATTPTPGPVCIEATV